MSKMADYDIDQQTRCERCEAPGASHWHDLMLCTARYGEECGGWLCENCAEGIATEITWR